MIEEDYSQLLELVRTPVDSSNVAAIAFSEALKVIVVEFYNDSDENPVYAYMDCTKQEYDDLEAAESIGKHLNRYIKRVKDYVRLS